MVLTLSERLRLSYFGVCQTGLDFFLHLSAHPLLIFNELYFFFSTFSFWKSLCSYCGPNKYASIV